MLPCPAPTSFCPKSCFLVSYCPSPSCIANLNLLVSMTAKIKIDISPYLSEKLSDFHGVIKKWKSCIGQTPSSTERISCSKTTTLLPSAKCTRPLFQGRTGCGGRPSGWHYRHMPASSFFLKTTRGNYIQKTFRPMNFPREFISRRRFIFGELGFLVRSATRRRGAHLTSLIGWLIDWIRNQCNLHYTSTLGF